MGLPLAKVSTLIDHVHHVWKENLLDQYFFEFEATVIKNLKKKKNPLWGSIQEDVLIWPWNPNGEYLAKFGYQLLQNSSQPQQPGSSMVDNLKPLWNKIWGLNVPAKVKNLIWRAC